MRKIKLGYNRFIKDNFVIDCENLEIYSIRDDWDDIPCEKRIKYMSMSGQTATFEISSNDFLKLGYADKHNQQSEIIDCVSHKLFTYVTFGSGEPKVILTDGENIAIFATGYAWQIIEMEQFRLAFTEWHTFLKDNKKKSFLFEYQDFNKNGEPIGKWVPKHVNVYGPYEGINLQKFIDLRELKRNLNFALEKGKLTTTYILSRFNIYLDSNRFYYKNPELNTITDTDGNFISIIKRQGWSSYKDSFYYRRLKDAFMECIKIEPGKDSYSNSHKLFEYEYMAFPFENLESIEKKMGKEINKKIKSDFVATRKNLKNIEEAKKTLLNYLIDNKNTLVALKDTAFKAGNCENGTYSFLSKYKIKTNENMEIDIKHIYFHEELNKMIEETGFLSSLAYL